MCELTSCWIMTHCHCLPSSPVCPPISPSPPHHHHRKTSGHKKLTSLYLFISLSYRGCFDDAIALFLTFFLSFFPIDHLKTFLPLPPLFTVQWQLHPWPDRECAAAKKIIIIIIMIKYWGSIFLHTGMSSPLLICVSIYLCGNNQLRCLVMGNVLFLFLYDFVITLLPSPQLCSVDVFPPCISTQPEHKIQNQTNKHGAVSPPCAG